MYLLVREESDLIDRIGIVYIWFGLGRGCIREIKVVWRGPIKMKNVKVWSA
jgi:hypothetical protein